jgi:hypothetical protein
LPQFGLPRLLAIFSVSCLFLSRRMPYEILVLSV